MQKEDVATLAQKKKPNFQPFGNKRSGGTKKSILGDPLTKSKNFDKPNQHHKSLKGNQGNGGGKNSR